MLLNGTCFNNKMTFSFEDIRRLVAIFNGTIVHETNYKTITNVSSVDDANETSLVFVDRDAKNKDRIISETNATTIICDQIPTKSEVYQQKCLIVVKHPKLFFAQLVNQQLKGYVAYDIHPSAVISPQARIAKKCHIGPHVYIGGEVEIGDNTIIHAHCSIYDNITIGNNVTIGAGCVIGAPGFGFVRDDEGMPIRFPQLGGVVIEDDVEIGANSCIDRGSLKNTIIKKGAKIDNLVQIAHNVEIGEYSYIIASTVIAGSTRIGRRCWIAPSRIMNKIVIGDDVTVGFGAVVLNSIPSGKTYMGNPAVELSKYTTLQYQLKKLRS